ncbi:response regulator transcription factor [Phyllobacterium sp. 21LDTY02-6]|jgi:DNA-binding NarL/FixJ family response regulator|uniref:response regulator transcription factor n=1 Tax=unclassified Phyllobacterium TaxID=2638441 RepID=UPI002020D146|nr:MULTISPECIES: response regulator transcription factor [unclassified Phyllobacterium]MCO4318780.1 response regulator transcription factor [Phyllobacterium sp. 21LDTY02-6]MCX8281953.1 response regulator transcription factor [Phyllobacterium sp. 0TCS1.6C]MCX8294416.1 response regulator transcription factor [Phyllobacterium sp. 0TCS1.6A]
MHYRFVIVDDHPLFRGALKLALANFGEQLEIMEIGDLESAKRLLHVSTDLDLVLLDLSLSDAGGLTGLIALRAIQPLVPIAIVSASDDAVTIQSALELGAAGFISKSSSPDTIRSAVQVILDGGIWSPLGDSEPSELEPELADLIRCIRKLTPQQSRVLGMMADGMLNKQIAHELQVSEATVKAHVSAVLYKLGVDSRTQAVIRLARFRGDREIAEAIES